MPDKPSDLTPFLIPFPERIKSQLFKWHGPGDGVILILAAVAGIISDIRFDQVAAVLTVVFILSWLIALDNGRVYQVFGVWWKTRALKARRGIIWQAKEGKSKRSASLLRDLEIHFIRSPVDGVPLIHNTRKREDAIVIIGDGARWVSENVANQAAFNRRLARIISSSAAGAPGVRTGVSQMFVRRPPNMFSLASAYGQSVHPKVIEVPTEGDPREIARYQFLHDTFLNQFELVSQYANSILMGLVITIRTEGALDRAAREESRRRRRRQRGKVEDEDVAQARLSENDVRRLAITQIAESVISELTEAGVDNPRLMTPIELRAFLRGGWDIVNIGQFQEDCLLDTDAVLDPDDTRHWPAQQIRATHRSLEIDGSHHAVIRLRRYPSTEVLPVDFRELRTVGARWITITLLGMTTRSSPEYQALDRMIPFYEDLRQIFGSSYEGPKVRRRKERLRERQEQISRSVFKVDASWLIVVSAATADDLEFEVQQVEKKCKAMGLDPKRVTGPIWIWRYFLSAVTGLNLI